MNGRSITQIIGIDVEAIYMTMLGLVALYLILTNAKALNQIITTLARFGSSSLVILQGRDLKKVGVTSV